MIQIVKIIWLHAGLAILAAQLRVLLKAIVQLTMELKPNAKHLLVVTVIVGVIQSQMQPVEREIA